jgi:exopolysaccharide production protein ExoZ
LLLVGVLGIEQRLGQLPRLWPINLIGDASYSIYLWHTMILAVAVKVAKIASIGTVPTIMFGVTAGVLGGIAAYLLLEAPLQAWFKRRKRATR